MQRRAAIEEGIIRRRNCIDKTIDALDAIEANGDEKTEIVKRALEAPLRQIAENAGLEGSVIVQNVKSNSAPYYGFDALRGEYGNMVEKVLSILPRQLVLLCIMQPVLHPWY